MSGPRKAILSLFICWHLLAVVLLPNKNSALTKAFDPILRPYASSLGILRGWGFFKEPPNPIFFEYTVTETEGTTLGPFLFPPPANKFYFRSSYVRRVVTMSRMFSFEEPHREPFTRRVILPYLCRQNPTASSLDLTFFATTPATLQGLQAGESFYNLDNRYAEQEWHFDCATDS